MKNRFIVIYTFFASAVFLFATGFFAFNLYNEYKTNLEKSETKYTELVSNIRVLSNNYSENTSSFASGIKSAVGDTGAYSFIQVRRNNETVVLYPTGKSKEETVSKLTKNFTSSFSINKQAVSIDCNIYLIRPDSIFYFARVSFLMILIITIITIIMIIYLNLTDNSSDVISLEEDSADDLSDEEIIENEEASGKETEDADETDKVENSDEAAEAGEAVSETENEAEEESSSIHDNSDFEEEEKHTEVTPEEVNAILAEPLTDEALAASEEKPAAEKAKLPVDEEKPAPLEIKQTDEADKPSGLYNPDTGIGWESYLASRLNNEIERAIASEIDLSLFIFQLKGIEKTSELFKNVCSYLAIQFQFKDLLFEYKEDCILAIKISMNVDEALKLSDKLYADICNIINSKNCRIGISSRSIRMVSGDRLILEAEQAIEHSDDSSPIIAFRVDSEKYRQLLEGN